MASDVDICNQALGHLGAKNYITSLTEKSTEAKQCAQHFPGARRATLVAADWPFAGRRVALSLSGDAVDPWAYSYALPTDSVRVRQVVPQDSDEPVPYEMLLNDTLTASYIKTDLAGAYLDYTADVEATGLYPPGFVDAFAAQLAMRLAMPITRNPKIVTLVNDLYTAALRTAAEQQLNSRQPGITPMPTSAYEQARS